MFAVLAAILFGVGFFIHGIGTATSLWFDPMSFLLAGLFCLALAVLGVGPNISISRR